MSLSNIVTTPIYTTTLLSRNTKVKFTPFLVMDERALLVAQESEDAVTMLNTLSRVVRSCLVDEKDRQNLTTFDIEHLFVRIREKSVGEESTLLFKCRGCGEKTPVTFPLSKTEMYVPEGHNKLIKLSPTLGILMKYPDMDTITSLDLESDPEITKMAIVGLSVDAIYDGDEVHYVAEEPISEIMKFIQRLTSTQYSKLAEFIETTPEVRLSLDWKCPKCGEQNDEVLSGISSFF